MPLHFRKSLLLLVLMSLFSGVAHADTKGIRGAFFDFVENPWELSARGVDESKSARFIPDGLLVMKDGLIVDFGEYEEISAKHPNLEITTFKDRLIMPGMIDAHSTFRRFGSLEHLGNTCSSGWKKPSTPRRLATSILSTPKSEPRSSLTTALPPGPRHSRRSPRLAPKHRSPSSKKPTAATCG